MNSIRFAAFFIALIQVSCIPVPAQVPTESAEPTDPFMPATSTSKPTIINTPLPTPIPSSTETFIPTGTFAPVPSERPTGDQISGTYKVDRGDSGYCALRAALQPLHVSSYEEVVVELFCFRGSPPYISGYAPPRKVVLSDNLAVYPAPEGYFYGARDNWDTDCYLVLQFEKDTIKVKPLGLHFNCRSWHAAYADGVYQLVDLQPPVLGCLSIWESCSALYPVP
jgi:hypothetical protein